MDTASISEEQKAITGWQQDIESEETKTRPGLLRMPTSGETFQQIERDPQNLSSYSEPDVAQMYESAGHVTTKVHEQILEWWIGSIDSVSSDYFTASLEDLSGQESIAEFYKDEADKDDREKVVEGARFIFYIMREDSHIGRRTISQLQFLPLRVLQESDIEFIKKLAKDYFPEESDPTD